jgi:hypothetical protein
MTDYEFKKGFNSRDEYLRLLKIAKGNLHVGWRVACALRDDFLRENKKHFALLYQAVMDNFLIEMEAQGETPTEMELSNPRIEIG